MGRKSWLTEDEELLLLKMVYERAIGINALSAEEYHQQLLQFVQSRNQNKLAVVKCSKTTARAYQRKHGIVQEAARPKTNGRVEAFNNIRNSISLCCLLKTIQSRVHRANFFSVDDVSVLVNPMGAKPLVRINF